MTATIVGAQFGDEGKGGVVDLLGDAADVVVRYQGGDNAGHTVVHDGAEYRLSLVPSGSVRGRVGVLGNGCVVNPRTLLEEVAELRDRGLDPEVRVAERAHVILPYHRELDRIEERAKADEGTEVGTTGRGIGPAYEDKVGRRGIRVGDLLDPAVLRERLEYVVPRKRALVEEVFDADVADSDAFDVEALHEEFTAHGEQLAAEGMPVDCGRYLAERRAAGDTLLLEGAQGTCLDIDHGDYPFVTSSNPTAGAAATGTGLPPGVVGDGAVVGVVKAYLSRVGKGPLPTELSGTLAERVREEGGEYGTVTGRPRRVGWLDLPMLRHAARVSGFTDLALNHLDVLASLETVRVAEAYELDGERLETLPSTDARWRSCTPVYRDLEGWAGLEPGDVRVDAVAELPRPALEYLDLVETATDTPVSIVGVGPARSETLVRSHPLR